MDTKKTFLGHKARAFDVKYSDDGGNILSSSEDGSSKLWNCTNGRCISTMLHNKEAEVLRSCFLISSMGKICTAGSDGNAIIWKNCNENSKLEMKKFHLLEHGPESQIYVCEQSKSSKELLIGTDNRLCLWDLENLKLSRTYDFYSTSQESESFGGLRNPNNEVYVFDAKISPLQDNIVCASLSDTTVRMLDTRVNLRPSSSQSSTTISLKNDKLCAIEDLKLGHATAINWSTDANTMLIALGTGQLALLDLRKGSIRALLYGHQSACYGAMFVNNCNLGKNIPYCYDGRNDNNCSVTSSDASLRSSLLCISWSSDCTVRLWDATNLQGIYKNELQFNDNNSTGIYRNNNKCSTILATIPDFPILSAAWNTVKQALICGGGSGGTSASFIGTPLYEIS